MPPRPSRRRAAPRVLAAALAVAVLAGCSGGERPGPRALLRVDAPVLVAMDGEPVAAAAGEAVTARDALARPRAAVAAGVGMLSPTPAARLIGAALAAADAPAEAVACPSRGDVLRETVETLHAALRPAARTAVDAFRAGVDLDWHPIRPDPVVAASAARPALDEARRAGHPVLLRVGPVTLAPRAGPVRGGGPGCEASIEARVVLRALRTHDGGVRFETVRRMTLAEARDPDALREWASDPARVEAALRRLGERIAADVRWLL
jgi:hypothetical protein